MIQNTTTSVIERPDGPGAQLGVVDRDQSDVLLDRDRDQLFGRHARLEHHYFETVRHAMAAAGLDVSAVQEANGRRGHGRRVTMGRTPRCAQSVDTDFGRPWASARVNAPVPVVGLGGP